MVEIKRKLNSVYYILYTINRGGKLVIKNLQQNNYFIRTASEILADRQLSQGFSPQELIQIKAIAEDE